MNNFKYSIAITGHRNISDIEKVKNLVRNQLKLLVQLLGIERIEIITGLAEGADTLVAEIAIDEGMSVRAILPAPINVYRSDFKGNALKEFNQFFSQENKSSKFVYEEIPLPEKEGNRSFSNQDRNQIYVRLMDYLIRRSNIIIAVGTVNLQELREEPLKL